MAVKFFGQFLLEKGVVSRQSVLQAVALQETTNLKFGEWAQQMDLIAEADVERIHRAQRSEDLRFGDMAVKLGILTEEQRQEILTRQRNSHLYIGEALIKIGALDERHLQQYLAEFNADQAPYAVGKVALPERLPHPDLWEIVADLSAKLLTRVAHLTVRPAPCKVIAYLPPRLAVASIDFSGSVTGRYLLALSAPLRLAIARAILQEEKVETEPEEVLDDAAMEFVNIVFGNIAAKAAQLGKTMEIAPPKIAHPQSAGILVPHNHIGLLFPLHEASHGFLEVAAFIRE